MNIRIMTAMALLALSASCAKWTEQQSIEIIKPSMENDPDLYSAYCGVIKEYKSSDHRIMYVTFDNVEQAYDQSCNLTSLPDSIDFVEICDPGSMSSVSGQMHKLASDKAFRFTLSISADKLENDYSSLVSDVDGENPVDQPDKSVFFADSVKKAFSLVDKYGFDGVRLQYSGYGTHHLTEEQLAQYTAEQEAFFSLVLGELKKRGNLLLFLNVRPENIVSTEILNEADYIILPTEGSAGAGDLSLAAIKAVEVCPDAKLLYAVTTITDDFQTGWFSAGEQIPLVSRWMASPASFDKSGMVIYDVRRSFYDSNRNVYRKIRGAIRNMNPNS